MIRRILETISLFRMFIKFVFLYILVKLVAFLLKPQKSFYVGVALGSFFLLWYLWAYYNSSQNVSGGLGQILFAIWLGTVSTTWVYDSYDSYIKKMKELRKKYTEILMETSEKFKKTDS